MNEWGEEKEKKLYYYETKHMFCLRLFIPHMLAVNLAHIQLRNIHTEQTNEIKFDCVCTTYIERVCVT